MTKKILIVEDNEMHIDLFRDLLTTHGYEVIISVDGVDVEQMVETHLPDLILMDIQLPIISGLERTKKLKSNDALKHIPVIAVTAFAMEGDEEKFRASGCDDYISKPIEFPIFLETISKHLH
jgi:two-component system, cell cycle response regulator DivK